MRSFSQNLSLVLAALFGCFIFGCKSTDNTQFADLGFSTTNAFDASAPPSSGSAKIVIKGTKAGASQQDIAVALMAATKKLAPKKTSVDNGADLRMAREAADAILAGDKVVLEGASPETADAIAADLRKAGLLVTTSK